jgi:hypothetical protein
MPGIIWALSAAGKTISKQNSREVFLLSAGSLLPLGLMLWIAFVIPMLFVNVTFVAQSFSDPFGWGWDFFWNCKYSMAPVHATHSSLDTVRPCSFRLILKSPEPAQIIYTAI